MSSELLHACFCWIDTRTENQSRKVMRNMTKVMGVLGRWMLSEGNDGNDDADDNGTDAAYALVRWDRGGCDAR